MSDSGRESTPRAEDETPESKWCVCGHSANVHENRAGFCQASKHCECPRFVSAYMVKSIKETK